MQLHRLLCIFFIIQMVIVYSMNVKTLFPKLVKVTDDLYVEKFDELYLSMQHIKSEDIDDWLSYIKSQILFGMRADLTYLSSLDGAQAFKNVLNNYKIGVIKGNNELWIACITRMPVTKDFNPEKDKDLIIMYVTVITTPEALLTSHMGISITCEEAVRLANNSYNKKPKRRSVNLHSFAAKVMLSRYPNKIGMLTVPTNIMRDILLHNLPKNAISIGDNIYEARLRSIEKDKLHVLMQSEKYEDETEEEWRKRIIKDANGLYEYYKIPSKLNLLRYYPPHINITEKNGIDTYTISIPGKPLIVFNKNNPHYQWLFTNEYMPQGVHLPYMLIDLKELAQAR